MAVRKIVLVLERDPAVRFAIGRVSLGPEVQLQYADHSEWITIAGDFAAVLADDTILQGSGEKLPITIMKERFGCPIVLMTNTGSRRIVPYARDVGASAVLFKPFNAGELRRQVGQMIGGIEIEPGLSTAVGTAAPSPGLEVFRPVEFGGQIATDEVFDILFVELEKRQPLEEGLDAFDVVERHLVKRALQACHGNQSRAARFLGITRNTLRKRIRKYGFSALPGDEAMDTEEA